MNTYGDLMDYHFFSVQFNGYAGIVHQNLRLYRFERLIYNQPSV
jgi:hypothetical protein